MLASLLSHDEYDTFRQAAAALGLTEDQAVRLAVTRWSARVSSAARDPLELMIEGFDAREIED